MVISNKNVDDDNCSSSPRSPTLLLFEKIKRAALESNKEHQTEDISEKRFKKVRDHKKVIRTLHDSSSSSSHSNYKETLIKRSTAQENLFLSQCQELKKKNLNENFLNSQSSSSTSGHIKHLRRPYLRKNSDYIMANYENPKVRNENLKNEPKNSKREISKSISNQSNTNELAKASGLLHLQRPLINLDNEKIYYENSGRMEFIDWDSVNVEKEKSANKANNYKEEPNERTLLFDKLMQLSENKPKLSSEIKNFVQNSITCKTVYEQRGNLEQIQNTVDSIMLKLQRTTKNNGQHVLKVSEDIKKAFEPKLKSEVHVIDKIHAPINQKKMFNIKNESKEVIENKENLGELLNVQKTSINQKQMFNIKNESKEVIENKENLGELLNVQKTSKLCDFDSYDSLGLLPKRSNSAVSKKPMLDEYDDDMFNFVKPISQSSSTSSTSFSSNENTPSRTVFKNLVDRSSSTSSSFLNDENTPGKTIFNNLVDKSSSTSTSFLSDENTPGKTIFNNLVDKSNSTSTNFLSNENSPRESVFKNLLANKSSSTSSSFLSNENTPRRTVIKNLFDKSSSTSSSISRTENTPSKTVIKNLIIDKLKLCAREKEKQKERDLNSTLDSDDISLDRSYLIDDLSSSRSNLKLGDNYITNSTVNAENGEELLKPVSVRYFSTTERDKNQLNEEECRNSINQSSTKNNILLSDSTEIEACNLNADVKIQEIKDNINLSIQSNEISSSDSKEVEKSVLNESTQETTQTNKQQISDSAEIEEIILNQEIDSEEEFDIVGIEEFSPFNELVNKIKKVQAAQKFAATGLMNPEDERVLLEENCDTLESSSNLKAIENTSQFDENSPLNNYELDENIFKNINIDASQLIHYPVDNTKYLYPKPNNTSKPEISRKKRKALNALKNYKKELSISISEEGSDDTQRSAETTDSESSSSVTKRYQILEQIKKLKLHLNCKPEIQFLSKR